MQKKEKNKKRSIMSESDKEMLLAVLVRNKAVFESFRDELLPEHFTEPEQVYALIWSLARNFDKEHSGLIDRQLMMTEISSAIMNNPNLITEEEQDEAEILVDQMFDDEYWEGNIVDSDHYNKWGMKAAKRFLSERLASRVQESVRGSGHVVFDVPEMLTHALEEAQRIESIGAVSDANMFPLGWDKAGGICITKTGMKYFDDFLNGGSAPGEVYGLMGPFGSCKTTLAVAITGWAARRAFIRTTKKDTWDGRIGVAFLVSYEARLVDELRIRTLSFAADIHRESLEQMGKKGLGSLSTTGKMKDYEKGEFQLVTKDKVMEPQGERKRAKNAQVMLNKHMRVLDMTGYDDASRGAGGGYIPEIASKIKAELRRLGPNHYVESVVVDYVGLMAKRHLAATERDENGLRHLVSGAPSQLRNQIADYFDCPVWAIHQLSGKANEKGPGASYSYTDASESKSFAENVDFNFIVGKPTLDGRCQLVCDKHRRNKGMPPVVLQIDGKMSDVLLASEYIVDANGTIVSKSTADSASSQDQAANEALKKTTKKKANDDEVY